jgi:hypothetical protein
MVSILAAVSAIPTLVDPIRTANRAGFLLSYPHKQPLAVATLKPMASVAQEDCGSQDEQTLERSVDFDSPAPQDGDAGNANTAGRYVVAKLIIDRTLKSRRQSQQSQDGIRERSDQIRGARAQALLGGRPDHKVTERRRQKIHENVTPLALAQ